MVPTSPKAPASLFTLSELLEGRSFIIPDYQRGYSWEDSQVQDLIEDIERLVTKTYLHFTGTIVASPRDGETEVYDIVDGQQRLTTLVILLMELHRQNPGNLAFKEIRSRFVQRGAAGNEKMVLTPNEETSDYFIRCILSNEEISPAIKSHACILEAKKKLCDWLVQRPAIHNAVLDVVLNKMGFIFFRPDNTREVGIMFEVINNRGKQLSELEKVKNYFIYYATVHDYKTLRDEINLARYDFVWVAPQYGLTFEKSNLPVRR